MNTARTSFSGALALLTLIVTTAVTAQTPEERLDAMLKQAYGGTATPPRTTDTTPTTPEQTIAWFGLIGKDGALATIKTLEKEADQLVFSSGTATALAEKMRTLEAQSKTAAVTAAEGGIGGNNKGLGYYCAKVTELTTAIGQRVQGFERNSMQFRQELMAIEVGKDDSAPKLASLVERFNQGIDDWKKHPDTQKIDALIKEVDAGMGATQKTSGSFVSAGNAAAEEARKLKTETKKLEKAGDRLVRLIELYVAGRDELLRELPGLQVESQGDVTKRDGLLEALRNAEAPKATAEAWRSIVGEPVAKRAKDADQALARIDALTASIRSESQACKAMPDPAASLKGTLENARGEIDRINKIVIKTFTERLAEIEKVDREHAELIEKNEQQAEDIGKKILDAEERYDKMPKDSPDRKKLYDNIVAARKIGADAAQAAIDLRLSRQTLVKEQQEVQRQSTFITGELRGAAEFLMKFGSN